MVMICISIELVLMAFDQYATVHMQLSRISSPRVSVNSACPLAYSPELLPHALPQHGVDRSAKSAITIPGPA